MATSEDSQGRIQFIERRFPRLTWKDRSNQRSIVVRKRLIIGSASSAEVTLEDPTVSRIHAELDPREDGLWIRDLESRNGTFLDRQRLRDACVPLDGQGQLRLGRTVLEIDYASGETEPVEMWAESSFHHLVGESPVMRELFALLSRVAASDASVLISGETGTGKELVARSLHDGSKRAEGPYVVVDCAALPENLLDAELFGHMRGAFTGAIAARPGAIESAAGGTVFLDEIGELPLSMQPKLLRVLEQRTVRRLGELNHRPVDVRFVSATHRDLLAMVGRGEFREDLYFRLCVIPISVPPLRARPQDIDVLVNRFMEGDALDDELMKAIQAQSWRGNVRELRNFVERARALGPQKMLQSLVIDDTRGAEAAPRRGITYGPSGLPNLGGALVARDDETDTSEVHSRLPETQAEVPVMSTNTKALFDEPFKAFRDKWIERGERDYLNHILEKHGRDVPAAARQAQVDPSYIYRLIRKYNL